MSVSSEFRDKKQEYYGKKISGLIPYANVLLPIVGVLQLWGIITAIVGWSGVSAGFVFNMVLLFLSVTAFATLRDYDALGFWANLLFLGAFIAAQIYNVVAVLSVSALLQNSANGVAASAGSAFGSAVMMGATLGLGLTIVPVLIAAVLLISVAVFYIVVFIRHRKFFFTSFKALKKEFLA